MKECKNCNRLENKIVKLENIISWWQTQGAKLRKDKKQLKERVKELDNIRCKFVDKIGSREIKIEKLEKYCSQIERENIKLKGDMERLKDG